MTHKNIPIVRGGAFATAVIIELALQIANEKWGKEVKITQIKEKKQIGYGRALGTDQHDHI